jgi:hypothetical protein
MTMVPHRRAVAEDAVASPRVASYEAFLQAVRRFGLPRSVGLVIAEFRFPVEVATILARFLLPGKYHTIEASLMYIGNADTFCLKGLPVRAVEQISQYSGYYLDDGVLVDGMNLRKDFRVQFFVYRVVSRQRIQSAKWFVWG